MYENREDKKISVIVPVYNVEKFLEKCVDSILGQTYKNLEVILVNDASPDNCSDICRRLAEKDSRIIVIEHEKNKGVSASRNSGLDIATGDFIGFVDGDDWVESDMYEYLLKSLIEHEADIAQCNWYYEEADGKSLTQLVKANEIIVHDKHTALHNFFLGTDVSYSLWSKLFNRKVIGNLRLNERYKRSEDVLFIYHILKKEATIVVTNLSKYHYVKHSESCISKFNETFFDNVTVAHFMLQDVGKESKFRASALTFFVECALGTIGYIQKNNMFKERYHLLRKDILAYDKEIIQDKDFSQKTKYKVLLLKYCPIIYNVRARILPYYEYEYKNNDRNSKDGTYEY